PGDQQRPRIPRRTVPVESDDRDRGDHDQPIDQQRPHPRLPDRDAGTGGEIGQGDERQPERAGRDPDRPRRRRDDRPPPPLPAHHHNPRTRAAEASGTANRDADDEADAGLPRAAPWTVRYAERIVVTASRSLSPACPAAAVSTSSASVGST